MGRPSRIAAHIAQFEHAAPADQMGGWVIRVAGSWKVEVGRGGNVGPPATSHPLNMTAAREPTRLVGVPLVAPREAVRRAAR